MVSCLPPQDQAGASGSSVISTTLVEARELLLLSVGVGLGGAEAEHPDSPSLLFLLCQCACDPRNSCFGGKSTTEFL